MEIKLKLCGMRRREDIDYLNVCRPDYAGFILSEGFRRSVNPELFRHLVNGLDEGIRRVGVFVNEPPENVMKYCAEGLDALQLHGDEDERYVEQLRRNIPESCEIWKAVAVRCTADIERWNSSLVDKLLLDAFQEGGVGGTGKVADWSIIAAAKTEKPFFVAGGINAGNFIEAARTLKPYGIDLSSGIETDGVKDISKIEKVIQLKNKLNTNLHLKY